MSTLHTLSVPSSAFLLAEAVQSANLRHVTIESMVLAHPFPPSLTLSKFPALKAITVLELRLCAPQVSAEAEASVGVMLATSSILADLPLFPGPGGGVLLCGPEWNKHLATALCPVLQPLSGSIFARSVRSVQLSTPQLLLGMIPDLASVFPFTTSIHCSSACKMEHAAIPQFVSNFPILSRLRFTLSVPFELEAILEAMTVAHLRERDSVFIMECGMFGRANECAEFALLSRAWEEKRACLPPFPGWKSSLVRVDKPSLLW